MAITLTPTPVHWSYFLALEDDLYDLARYIDFSEPNHKTFSIEIARLLMSASAEVDSILKQLTKRLDENNKAKSLPDYHSAVTSYAPKLVNFRVSIPRYGISLCPWQDWSATESPSWWRSNNSVKHHRHSEFHQATLKNCLNAMGALLISVVHLHANEGKTGKLVGLPKLFVIPQELGGGQKWSALGHSQLFYLNDDENPFFLMQRSNPPS